MDLRALSNSDFASLEREVERERTRRTWNEKVRSLREQISGMVAHGEGWVDLHSDVFDQLHDTPRQGLDDLLTRMPAPADERAAWRAFFRRLTELVDETQDETPSVPVPAPARPRPRPAAAVVIDEKRLAGILARLAEPSEAIDGWIGVDFGTSLSKLIVRDESGQIVDDIYELGETFDSSIAFDRTTRKVLFSAQARRAYDTNPKDILLVKSLKRTLLEAPGRALPDVARTLTTGDAILLSFTSLYQRCCADIRRQLGPSSGFRSHLAAPASEAEGKIRPFWHVTGTEAPGLTYWKYLRYLAAAGHALAEYFREELPEDLDELLAATWALQGRGEDLEKILRAQQPLVTCEPIAAVAEGLELWPDGVYIVVDSGAGTTDLAIFGVHAGEVNLVAQQCVRFGGDDVDRVMLSIVEAALGSRRWDAYLEPLVISQLEELKPRLAHRETVTFEPMRLKVRATNVDLRPDEVEQGLAASLSALSKATNRLIDDFRDQFGSRPRARGPQYTLRDLRKVILLGGNANLPWVPEAIRRPLSEAGLNFEVEGLALPASITERGWTSLSDYQVSAVAVGASRREPPSPVPQRAYLPILTSPIGLSDKELT